MDNLKTSGPGRFLAPIALVVVAIAFFIVVLGSTGNEEGGSGDQAGTTERKPKKKPARTETETETTPTTTTEQATYTVKAGDSLAGIAEETGVPVETIQELNPELDPQGLVVGQKIKLRE